MFSQTIQQTKTNGTRLLAMSLLLFLLPSTASALPTEWDWGHPSPHGNQHNAIVWGDNEFVAVSDGGNIVTSRDNFVTLPFYSAGDANSWVKQTSPTTNTLNAIAWSGSRYVSVGDEGTIVNSTAENTWVTRRSGVTHKLTDVIWNGSFFLVIGEQTATINHPINGTSTQPAAVILKSQDIEGVGWTLESPTLDANRYDSLPPPRLNGITWDDDKQLFVATSDSGVIITSNDGIAWSSRSINSIAWDGSGLYMAVGDNGLVLTSTNGTTWTTPTPLSPLNSNLHDIVWEGTRFVIVGENSTVINATPPGTSWTWNIEDPDPANTLGEIVLRGVARGSNIVAVGDDGTIMTRPPGSSGWIIRDPGTGITEDFYDVAWDNASSSFVTVGSSGRILISPISGGGGATWNIPTTIPSGFTTDLLNASWGNNVFIATGKSGAILTSSDGGNTWNDCTDASCPNSEWLLDSVWDATSGNHIVVGSNGTVITSNDNGTTWNSPTSPPNTSETLLSVTTNGTNVIGGGEQAIQIDTTTPTTSWNISNSRVAEDLNDVVYNNNQYTAVGNNGTILTSGDSALWGTANFIPASATGIDLLDITALQGTDDLYTSGTWGVVISSTDNGDNWIAPITPPSRADFFYGVAARPSTIAATTVGSGGSLFSTTNRGDSWTDAGPNKTTEEINGLAIGNSMMVAVGNNATVLSSTNDGLSWSDASATIGTTEHLHSVAWKSSDTTRFVTVGNAGTVRVSNDGANWNTPTGTLPDSSNPLYAVAWGNDLFIAVGGATNSSIIYTSPNGDNWTLRSTGVSKPLRDVTWSANIERFIVVGDNGTILTSQHGVNWIDRSGATTVDLDSVISSDDRVLASGTAYSPFGGTVLQSTDGANWGGGGNSSLEGLLINDLAFGGTQFVGVGPSGLIVVSPDGQNWEKLATGTNSLLKAALWDGSKFITGGASGHILYSTNPDLIITGGFEQENVRNGEVARYSFTVRNGGPSIATAAKSQGALPANTSLLSASTTRGSCSMAGDLICDFGDLASGESATVTVDITVSEVGTLQLLARATLNVEDADLDNNTTRDTMEVTRGNSPTGGAALSYFSLSFVLLYFLMIYRKRINNLI